MAENQFPPTPNTVSPNTIGPNGAPPRSPYQSKNHTVLGVSLFAIAAVVVVSLVAMRDDAAVIDTQPSPPAASSVPSVPTPDTTPTPSTPDSPPLPNTAPTSPTSPDMPLTPRADGGGEPL